MNSTAISEESSTQLLPDDGNLAQPMEIDQKSLGIPARVDTEDQVMHDPEPVSEQPRLESVPVTVSEPMPEPVLVLERDQQPGSPAQGQELKLEPAVEPKNPVNNTHGHGPQNNQRQHVQLDADGPMQVEQTSHQQGTHEGSHQHLQSAKLEHEQRHMQDSEHSIQHDPIRRRDSEELGNRREEAQGQEHPGPHLNGQEHASIEESIPGRALEQDHHHSHAQMEQRQVNSLLHDGNLTEHSSDSEPRDQLTVNRIPENKSTNSSKDKIDVVYQNNHEIVSESQENSHKNDKMDTSDSLNVISKDTLPDKIQDNNTEDQEMPQQVEAEAEGESDQLQGQTSSTSSPSPTQLQSKRAAEETPHDAPASKGPRTKRELAKKTPKVYPPRKPRVRSVAVEPLTMTIRTDSALSTLASAAVAIKDHQGSLSALSVPPLSPSTQASQTSQTAQTPQDPQTSQTSQALPTSEAPQVPQASSPPSGSSSTPPDTSAPTTTTPLPSRSPGRSPIKGNVPHDAGGYRCELCPGERFGRVHDLKRHQISKHNEMTWPCDFCHRPFVRRDALLRHYSVKAARRDGVHPTEQEENRLQEAKARANLAERLDTTSSQSNIQVEATAHTRKEWQERIQELAKEIPGAQDHRTSPVIWEGCPGKQIRFIGGYDNFRQHARQKHKVGDQRNV
ncbi:hypothetical protein BGX26_008387 [Mortierella sp. AD094]|nr:hypothetical protein BGX26_008387 [Mortierella sp. AD094]